MNDNRPLVYFTSLIDSKNDLLQSLVAKYSTKVGTFITVVDDPRDANFIIIAETGYFGLSDLSAALHRSNIFRGKYVLMINNTDWPYPVFDGFYPSLTKRCSGAYPWAFHLAQAPNVCIEKEQANRRKYLYSFVGRASTHNVRKRLLALDRADCPCIDIDNIPKRLGTFDNDITYAEIMYNSHFVLCPRGFGASSIRLFEVMRAGRVPVIISDKWTAPPVGDWNSFSIKIGENDIHNIPFILASRKHFAGELGRIARETYTTYFSSEVYLEVLITFYLQRARLFSRNRLMWRSVSRIGAREIRSFFKEFTLKNRS